MFNWKEIAISNHTLANRRHSSFQTKSVHRTIVPKREDDNNLNAFHGLRLASMFRVDMKKISVKFVVNRTTARNTKIHKTPRLWHQNVWLERSQINGTTIEKVRSAPFSGCFCWTLVYRLTFCVYVCFFHTFERISISLSILNALQIFTVSLLQSLLCLVWIPVLWVCPRVVPTFGEEREREQTGIPNIVRELSIGTIDEIYFRYIQTVCSFGPSEWNSKQKLFRSTTFRKEQESS